jgi:hypothetical protein
VIEKTADSKFGSWSSPEARLTIEYPLELLDEIRLNVCSSFHTNPRGGVETGGLLFGTRSDNAVRIAAWRPISCEHSKGFAFILSERDLLDLARLMEGAKTDRGLKDLQIVGWFLSHTRAGLGLTDTDLSVFDQCFPLHWQFTMVLRPGNVSTTKAAFFVRDENGRLCAHNTDREFIVDPLHNTRAHSHGARPAPRTLDGVAPVAQPGLQRQPNSARSDAALVRIGPEPNARWPHEAPRFVRERPRRKKSKLRWLWSIPIVALLGFGALFVKERYFTETPPPATFALQLQDGLGGQMRIVWDKEAKPIQAAAHGVIEIMDGGKAQILALDAAQLRQGVTTYGRRSGDVKVKLSVFQQNGNAAAAEMAQFLGPLPGDPAGDKRQRAWDKEKADLQAEIKLLRSQLAQESGRSQQLSKLVRILQTRLDLLTPKK